MNNFIRINWRSVLVTAVFAAVMLPLQILTDYLASFWHLSVFLAASAFAFFHSMQSLRSSEIFLKILCAAAGCQFMCEIYFFCNTITYLDVPPNFSVSSLADLALFLFLFTANRCIPGFDRKEEYKKCPHCQIAWLAPLLILVTAAVEFYCFRNIN